MDMIDLIWASYISRFIRYTFCQIDHKIMVRIFVCVAITTIVKWLNIYSKEFQLYFSETSL